MSKNITINPITRLEGHGKIEIFLDDHGNVEDAYWQVVELRGFERFCVGRPAEELPRITSNICGVCPTPHNIASVKALDDLFGVEPTPTARLIRQLQYNAFFVEDHYVHFFFLASPDFLVGPDAVPAERNILGVIRKVGVEIGSKVIEVRGKCREIIRLITSKPPHPESCIPGGVPRGITEGERVWIIKTADECVEFAQYALQLFKDAVLGNKEYADLIRHDAYTLKVGNMGLVDENNMSSLYDGQIRVTDVNGNESHRFDPRQYIEHIGEWVEPWTYVKMTHLRNPGWNGLVEGEGTSLYRVGPLGRLNVADSMSTPLAQAEYERMFAVLGGKPSHHTLAFHWARLIEALQAAEEMQRIANHPLLTSKDIRNMDFRLKREGIGCVEAARGTLIHHYQTDERGIATNVNLIVATQHNAAPICLSIKKAAAGFIKGPDVKPGLLNMVEMAFRAYDPCLACATHTLPGQMPLEVNIRQRDGTVLRTLRRAIP